MNEPLQACNQARSGWPAQFLAVLNLTYYFFFSGALLIGYLSLFALIYLILQLPSQLNLH